MTADTCPGCGGARAEHAELPRDVARDVAAGRKPLMHCLAVGCGRFFRPGGACEDPGPVGDGAEPTELEFRSWWRP